MNTNPKVKMANYLSWISFVSALLTILTNNFTLCIAACTATECLAGLCTRNDLQPADGLSLREPLNIRITHDYPNFSCSSLSEDQSTNQPPPPLPRDCTEILSSGHLTSGIYKINPHPQGIYHSNTSTIHVYCDMDTKGGGWTLFQRRHNGLVDFYRDWEDYKHGFGYVNGDYWLGLQNLHWLTSTASYELRVDIQDFDGNIVHAKYNSFQIGDERLFYKLILGDYEGTAGDSLSQHNYQSFSTRDQDHDINDASNCAVSYSGAWWYADCHSANLNGLYMGPNQEDAKGMVWYYFENSYKVLKSSEMKIRHIG